MKISKETMMTKTPVLFMDYTKGGYRREYAVYINYKYTGVNEIVERRKRRNDVEIKYTVENERFDNLIEALKKAGYQVDANEPTD